MYSLQGNIAAGKSTLLDILDDLRFDVVPEPITKWQQTTSAGGNLLELFYNDTERWAYTFQSYAFLSRMRAQLEAQQGDNRCRMFERSIVSDREVFAVNCHQAGLMSDVEWDIYCDWHEWLLGAFPSARPPLLRHITPCNEPWSVLTMTWWRSQARRVYLLTGRPVRVRISSHEAEPQRGGWCAFELSGEPP